MSEYARIFDRRQNDSAARRAHRCTGAHTTIPLTDQQTVRQFLQIARAHDAAANGSGTSWYLLLLLGFNTSLRIGDLVRLRVRDVRGRERVRVIAEKTGKLTNIYLQPAVRAALDKMISARGEDEYIFRSRQRSRKDGEYHPITRQQAYNIIRRIGLLAGFEGHIGCHTMRKTFAYDLYKNGGGGLALVQKILNHTSQEATIHYLGLDQEAVDRAVEKMSTMV